MLPMVRFALLRVAKHAALGFISICSRRHKVKWHTPCKATYSMAVGSKGISTWEQWAGYLPEQ